MGLLRRATIVKFFSLNFLTSVLFTLSLLPIQVQALHESDIGVVDWYNQLVGIPLSGSVVTSPAFHRASGLGSVLKDSQTEEKAQGKDIILTITTSNVLAALDPEDGSVLWRYVFEAEDRLIGYYKSSDGTSVATLSGPGGSTVRIFHAHSGLPLLEKKLHKEDVGKLSEPVWIGKDVVFSLASGADESATHERPQGEEKTKTANEYHNEEAVYILTNGYTVSKLNKKTGDIVWEWNAEDQGSLIIHSTLHLSQDLQTLYAIGIGKTVASFSLQLTSLSTSTGEVVATQIVPSNIADPLSQVVLLAARQADAKSHLLWIDNLQGGQGQLRFVPLIPSLTSSPVPLKGESYARIIDIGLSQIGWAVVQREDGSAFAANLKGEKVVAVWEFIESKTSDDKSESVYSGSVADKEGNVVIGRVWWDHQEMKAASQVFSSKLGKLISGKTEHFAFESDTHGIIGHATVSTSNANAKQNILVTTSTGSVQFWESDSTSNETPLSLKWVREESLANVNVAEFVEIPEKSDITGSGEDKTEGEGESFTERVWRQVGDAQRFPQYAVNFVKRFITGSYASSTSAVVSNLHSENSTLTTTTTTTLSRDPFGFRQLIIVATNFGKLYALDSSSGEIVWQRVLGLGWAAQVGGRIVPVKVYVTKSVSDGWGGDPEVVLVAQRRAQNTLVDTVVFHVNALTGSDILGKSKDKEVLEGHDVIQGPLVDVHLLDAQGENGSGKMVVLFDEFLQTYLYPETIETKTAFSKLSSRLSFPLRTSIETRRRIAGHQINPSNSQHRSLAYPTWSLTLPPSEDVVGMIPQKRGVVANIGKVLGNRTTLYKYLDGRAFVVLTETKPQVVVGQEVKDAKESEGKKVRAQAMCGIYLVDSTKGTILYHAEVKAPSIAAGVVGTKGRCNVKATFTENWLVYHYYEDESGGGGSGGGAKGYRIVSVEFYEGEKVDEKIMSSDLSAYSNDTLKFSTYEQSYVFPYGVTAMTTTSTKFGITSKDLIVATTNDRIQSFPRRVLDPRRPHRKPTSEELEEFLIAYDSLLPNDPRRVLSHLYSLANVNHIITSPALLESTSLVLGLGLDLFLTRTSPSGTFDVLSEGFNKAQLVFTVGGLLLGIMVTRPMVRRKGLKEKWYAS